MFRGARSASTAWNNDRSIDWHLLERPLHLGRSSS